MTNAFEDGIQPKKEEVEVAYKFMKEFQNELQTRGTNKRFLRMIFERTISFGPKRKGPNMLINKFITKEQSFFARIQKLAEDLLGVQPELSETDEIKVARLLKIDMKHLKAVEEVL